MSFVGNLQDLGLGEILQIVSLSRKSGTLTLRSEGRVGTVIFRQGQVVRSSSSAFKHTLGSILLSKSLIDNDTLQNALLKQQNDGFRERLGVILINSFGIPNETIADVVREQIENIVFSMFEWGAGSFEFIAQENVESVDSTRLDPLQFMLEQGLNPQFLAMEGSRITEEKLAGVPADKEPEEDQPPAAETTELKPDLAPPPLALSGADSVVVIVDDDAPTLRLLTEALDDKDYNVQAAARIDDALLRIDKLVAAGCRPVVLIDLIMPKTDSSGVLGGLELLEELRSRHGALPSLMMSDYRMAEAEQRVSELNCRFLVKPRRADVTNQEIFNTFMEKLLCEMELVLPGGVQQ
ncbi:MAG TPA: DUF4388 domain-containing protein [Deltaproteobacteria bacterium]|nr:DUF4388 domain-containing protein [Deltaproteobacteria bacterium]